MLEYLLGGPLGPTAPLEPSQSQRCLKTHRPPRTFFTPFGPIHYPLRMFISPLVKLSTVPNTYISLGQGKSCGFVQFLYKADVERVLEALGGHSIGGRKARLSLGRSTYRYYSRYHCLPDRDLSISRSCLGRPHPAPPAVSATQVASNANSGPSGNCDPSSVPTPAPEGPLTNDQVNHIIQRLQDTILNNGGRLGPNGGAPRRLCPSRHHPLPT